ncbi:MAG TPA: MOSC domain-containing protein [Steroidobacteraceae bacterium]|nr:MOSC domain-containing protein [Steroidobacteraceae bacterium]
MPVALHRMYRYPVKGMTGESLEHVALRAGERLPGDRRFAIAHGGTTGPETRFEWRPRSDFLMLARNERLALLEARYNETSCTLTLLRHGRSVARGNPGETLGRAVIEQFFAAFMGTELRGAPKLVEAAEGGFTDSREGWLSLINLASVRDLERVVRAPIDPLRFRANLYIDGLAPWRERDWVGGEIAVGAARLRVMECITRCAATNVNPATGARDLNIPLALQQGIGRGEMGVYAKVITAGTIAAGDAVALPFDEARGEASLSA